PARLASKADGSEANVYRLAKLDAKTVCLCYLDHGTINKARYLLRRLKRRNPEATIIAAFWGYPDDGVKICDSIGCEVVTKFDDAVKAIVAATASAQSEAEAA